MEIKDLGGAGGGPPSWGKISGTPQKLAGEPDEPYIDWDEDENEITPREGGQEIKEAGAWQGKDNVSDET